MEFRMNDIPFENPQVAEMVVRCLQQCDQSLNAMVVEAETLMPADDLKLLRRGVAQIVGGDMFDLWRAVVRQHPTYENACYGKPASKSRDDRHD